MKIMKKFFGFMSKVNEIELSMSDAFTNYLEEIYFPGAEEVLDHDTVDFEFATFLNTYAK